MYYVYVLKSLKDQKLYIGYTTSVIRRLEEHKSGKSRSTRYRLPIKVIFYEGYISKQDALRREKYFKTTQGKKALKLMHRKSLKITN